MTKEGLLQLILQYNPKADVDLITLAYDFADRVHTGQKRLNGESIIDHCLGTAFYLAQIKMDDATIIGGLLHEAIDEGGCAPQQIRKEFGDDIAQLVEGVSNLGRLKYRGIERYAENVRKVFISMGSDIRIILIKFADRLHNLETLHVLPREKQERIAREVLEIYAPIADRLGIGYFRRELEDLAFKYVDPKTYEAIASVVQPRYEQKQGYLDTVKKIIQKDLSDRGISVVRIENRLKSIHSTHSKMQKKHSDSIEGIYDLIALRIIVASVADCYAALGIVHQRWHPLPGRIKDYISQPKENNYRALHTTVVCEEGEIVEFQIQDPDMYKEARFGIAAHWHYTESHKLSQKIMKNVEWLKELMRLQEAAESDEEYVKSLKLDVFRDRIFVFTPKGDVIHMPEGATPIDFAYYIHSDIGRKCSGARINDSLASLSTQLKSGDVVEIIVEKNRKRPSVDWLSIAKTHLAQAKIRVQLKEDQ